MVNIFSKTFNYGYNVLTNREYFWHFFWYVIILEVILNLAIIHFVPYTEIDWKAYMQEVSGAMFETRDYTKLKGDTGPLVYPALFVYIFEFLYKITDNGENIQKAQYIFMVVYILNQMMTLYIYHKSGKIPQYVSLFLCLSKRIHSIYVLRCFNDTITLNLTLLAIIFFIHQKWFMGMIVYACACCTKMNALLYAPGLLLLLFESVGPLYSILLFLMFFSLQIIMAIPFLLTNAKGYFGRAYEFGRVFTYIWTVNFKFLPEHIFVNKYLGLGLLALQLVLLLAFIFLKWSKPLGGVFNIMKDDMNEPYKSNVFKIILNWFKPRKVFNQLTADHILMVLFGSNFIGIACSRSMHYQYYCWYFYTLPYLLYKAPVSIINKIMIFITIEIIYNIYPSNAYSSISLQLCHLLILVFMADMDVDYPLIGGQKEEEPVPEEAKEEQEETIQKKEKQD